jgi:fatty acid desaturase
MSFPKTVQTNAKATAATLAAATLVVVSTRIALLAIALRYVKQLLYYFLQKYLFFHLYSYKKKEGELKAKSRENRDRSCSSGPSSRYLPFNVFR